jgi:hypothetical protein
MMEPIERIERITPIPRGADLTEADLRQIVDDFYEVRNWAALKMHMPVPEMKEQLFRALEVRLGRRKQTGV